MKQLLRKTAWDRLPFSNSIFKTLFLCGIFTSTPALALYGLARAWGALPAEAAWGGNHGPWHGEHQGIVVVLGLLFSLPMPLVSFLCALGVAIEERSFRALVEGLALTAFQFACAYAMMIIFWVVD